MRKNLDNDRWPAAPEALLAEILTDARSDDEQLWALRQAFDDNVELPADAFVIGEPVGIVAFDYDGNTRRGLSARCRRHDGGEYVVAAPDVVFPEGSVGADHVAAYRSWLGLEPLQIAAAAPNRRPKRHKAVVDDLDLDLAHSLGAPRLGPAEFAAPAVEALLGDAVPTAGIGRCRAGFNLFRDHGFLAVCELGAPHVGVPLKRVRPSWRLNQYLGGPTVWRRRHLAHGRLRSGGPAFAHATRANTLVRLRNSCGRSAKDEGLTSPGTEPAELSL